MGDNVTKSSEEEELSSYTQIFKEQCPFFMAIGMSYQEFWYEDCWIAKYYLEAYKIRKEQINEQLWLQGMYVFEAILDASPVLHAFSKKGTKAIPYSKQPYSLFKKTEKEKEKEVEIEREKAKIFFENWAKRVNKKMEIKEKK
ncbi:MAG TPA: hypothetical protein IAB40_06365 [Candidatus Onthocola stercoravium]|nr:hypothetical protein [Candidatus Onthocola stercoravium]